MPKPSAFVKLDEIMVGPQPRALAASHDGKWLFASLADSDRLTRVDLSQRRRAGSLEIPGGPCAIVAHPQVAKLYVAAAHANVVAEIDIPSAECRYHRTANSYSSYISIPVR